MKLTGMKAWVFFDSFDESRVISYSGIGAAPQTQAEKWYRVMEKGTGSNLPLEKGFPFQAPAGAVQITLVSGDIIYPLDPSRFCKTSASLSAEQGSVDVGDDCDPGATILDGIIAMSGSLAGLFRYDDKTGKFDNVTDDILSRFFDTVRDNGNGIYELQKRTDEPVFLLCCLNSNASNGQFENWIFIPINISSVNMSLGNTDAQNKDLSWSKGEGPAVKYERKKITA
jgi:hypothetical protein